MIEKLPFMVWSRRQTLTTLIFHRVMPLPDPLRPDEPDRDAFDQLMSFVAENFSVMALPEAVDCLKRGTLPQRACSITFDDGYADNLTIALPILEKYRLPATVFIATGYLDGGRMFNDTVIDAIASARNEDLDLKVFDLGSYSLKSDREKLAAIRAILNHIKCSPPELRDRQVERIMELTACGQLQNDIMLTRKQVKDLAERGIEIGGHTVAHTILTSLDEKRSFEEITKGKLQLEETIGKPVTSFAYPNGRPGLDYSENHVQLVKKAGFMRAVSTAEGVGFRGSDIYQLPRFTPWGKSKLKLAVHSLRNSWRMV